MSYRGFALLGARVAVVVLSLTPVLIAGQAPATPAPTGTALRTLWGEPDLQGIWTNETSTPLERPARFAGREFLTEAERAEQDGQRAADRGNDQRAERGTPLDVAGAYNAVFTSLRKTGKRTSLIVDPPDGRMPPRTEEGQKRVARDRRGRTSMEELAGDYGTERMNRADGPEDRGLGERCLGGSLPDFGGFYRIVQSPGYVSIFHDTGQGQGFNRIVPITDRPHLSTHIRQWWGDPRGRWEGETLVVDTINFTPKTNYQGSRENLHLVERFTRTDANTLTYRLTVEDPTTFTRPWTMLAEMSKQDDRANRIYYEPRCHEGNYGLTGIFANTRAAEKAFAEGRGPDPLTTGLELRAVDGRQQ